MPTGERPNQSRRPRRLRPVRGFTYLALLLVIALWAAMVAGWAQRSQQAGQRERELELLFRGGQIAAAIAAWRAASPPPVPAPADPDDSVPQPPRAPPGPPDLQSLLDDRRGPLPRHHLRQLYADPFTGRPDWLLITDAQQRVLGVRSRVARPRLLQGRAAGGDAAAATGPLLSDWVFRAAPAGAATGGT